MKKALIVLSLVCSIVRAHAQKHHLYADAGISLSQFMPGASATYNYNIIPYTAIGIGVQAYGFFPTITNRHTLVPALYGDMRINIRPKKKNQFFVTLDAGVNFYKHTTTSRQYDLWLYFVNKDNGIYSSFGLGYLHMITKRGGIYFTIKTITNSYRIDRFDLLSGAEESRSASRGTLAVSCGFRW